MSVPRQHVQRADLASLIIRSDMNHRQSLRRSSQAFAVSQGMMLCLCRHPLPRHEPLPLGFERLDEERINGDHGLTLPALMFSFCGAQAMSAGRQEDTDPATEIECEIVIQHLRTPLTENR